MYWFLSSLTRHFMSIVILTQLIMFFVPMALADDYICGDANGDGVVNVGDAVFAIKYVFLGDFVSETTGAIDANCDNAINVGDAVYLIRYVFLSGPAPCCPEGSLLIGDSGCKGDPSSQDGRSQYTEVECIEYEYDGEDMLELKHINTYLNCCPNGAPGFYQIHSDIGISEGLIVLDESDNDGSCKCGCHFDVSYKVFDISPGVYTIRIFGFYRHSFPDDPLEFTVDLTGATSGLLCEE
ncbi:MAG: hypothetical protein GY841_14810 [FCB group bacterium]|nr:hypothetical protein [FCB group bacterium]